MDEQKKDGERKECCRSGRHCCSCAVMMGALILLLLGGVLGYLLGKSCTTGKMACPPHAMQMCPIMGNADAVPNQPKK